jgi:hypothetical protein
MPLDIGFSTSLKAKQNYKNPNEIHQFTNLPTNSQTDP